jgi:purine-nucleoside phosphorylase
VKRTLAILRSRCPLRPRLGIVLGSGFQDTLRHLDVITRIPYARLPGFPRPTVAGHAGELLVGRLGGTPVLILSGRAHYYEGHGMDRVTFAMRALAGFGVKDIVITNAAGGIQPRLRRGDFMLLSDHINLMGVNPLRGPAQPDEPRFVDLTHAYDAGLSNALMKAARRVKLRLHRGVYLAVSGPSYETPAEIRAFARLGADAVGMSTVPEVIVARQLGMRVAAVSCITNLAAGRSAKILSHHDVLAAAQQNSERAARWLTEFATAYGS